MAIDAFIDALAGDPAVASQFSEDAEIRSILAFETALARVEAEEGIIPLEAASAIEAACRDFLPNLSALRAGMAVDGVLCPSLIVQLRQAVGNEFAQWVHFGTTSQDAIDTGLILRLKPIVTDLDGRLANILEALDRLKTADGGVQLMAQTRMQRALPITAADKIETWKRPLLRHRARLPAMTDGLLRVQFGGPVGTRDRLDGKGRLIADKLASRLGLGAADPWHTGRDNVVAFGDWLSLVSGSLGKIGVDVGLMTQNEVGTLKIARGGSSSVMPHKANPVAAELLVTLARYNAGLVGTFHNALVHENERSGAAWTLEWRVLPQMTITTAAALRHASMLIANIRFSDTLP